MAVSSEVVAVTDEAVALNDPSPLPMHLALTTSDQVYLGGSDVDATVFGWDETGGVLNMTLLPGDVLYAVCAESATANVSVLRS